VIDQLFIETWPIALSVGLFIVGAIVIGWTGPKLTYIADELADRTGIGEAMVGAVLLGGATSLSGITTTATAAAEGHAELALSNAIGGIAAQTVFLAVADFFYRRANIEHAAVSPGNLVQGPLLIGLLGFLLFAFAAPELTWLGIHPITPILVLAYVGGLHVAWKSQDKPLWQPIRTDESQMEESESGEKTEKRDYERSMMQQWLRFGAFTIALAISGWVIARSGVSIAHHSGLNQTVVGALFTSVATSLPELITAIVAVRHGALALAVGNIIGGNSFDTLFAAVGDIAYRDGSIYHAVSDRQILLIGLTIIMTSALLMGLVRRQRHGPLGIGWESLTILIVYAVGMTVLAIS
jgi:cation:H+ antiporter